MRAGNFVLLGVGVFLLATLFWWRLTTPAMAGWVPVLVALPWLLALPGVWQRRRKAYQALTLVASCYIGFTVLETVANPAARSAAAVASLACGGVFMAAIGALRAEV